ncbi:hypothetical protein [Amycolatopsis thermophila]|uniref:Uncharacterized protein n=1 Tax=Amycolatopsis thermophila TaxID=206084 RepID=A0ABU0ELI7_9PSEU|nr:hypothetical protein [Amycolatopsis thermophila]MDQ0376139.1 hypothetical protein [Amycolatopsis thermophila]
MHRSAGRAIEALGEAYPAHADLVARRERSGCSARSNSRCGTAFPRRCGRWPPRAASSASRKRFRCCRGSWRAADEPSYRELWDIDRVLFLAAARAAREVAAEIKSRTGPYLDAAHPALRRGGPGGHRAGGARRNRSGTGLVEEFSVAALSTARVRDSSSSDKLAQPAKTFGLALQLLPSGTSAERFQGSHPRATRWAERYRVHGAAGMNATLRRHGVPVVAGNHLGELG